jgi:hypothetical protein
MWIHDHWGIAVGTLGAIVVNLLLISVRSFASHTGLTVRWLSRSYASERAHIRKLKSSSDALLARKARRFLRLEVLAWSLAVPSVLAFFWGVAGAPGPETQGMAQSGPEDWSIDGRTYHVNRSYYVREGSAEVVYVVEYQVADKAVLFGVDDERALKLAWPIMKYAYESRAYERAQFDALRGRAPAMTRIGVDLVAKDGGHLTSYRVVQSVGEIVSRSKENP